MARKPKPRRAPAASEPAASEVIPATERPVRLGIVVAYRREPDLDATCQDALASAAGVETTLYRVEDKTGAGCGRCRHLGITRAAADGCNAVLIIDAHMRFAPGLLAGMAHDAVARPRMLFCAPCHHNEKCSFDGSPYRGAMFTLHADNGLERVALAAQWCKPDETANAIMGACYAFSTSLYSAMGEPLRALHSWGCDEEYLSGCAWFAGGRVEVSDRGECAHLYRNSGVADHGPGLTASIWANRLQLVDMLPLPPGVSVHLREYTRQSAVFSTPYMRELIDSRIEAHRGIVEEIRAKLEASHLDAERFLSGCRESTVCNRKLSQIADVTAAAAPAPLTETTTAPFEPQVVVRQAERCERCDQVNPFRATCGVRPTGDRVAVGYARCWRCGHRAKIVREA